MVMVAMERHILRNQISVVQVAHPRVMARMAVEATALETLEEAVMAPVTVAGGHGSPRIVSRVRAEDQADHRVVVVVIQVVILGTIRVISFLMIPMTGQDVTLSTRRNQV